METRMTPDELTQRYFLARILWWRDDLDRLDAEAIAQLVKVLREVKADILKQLDAEAEGLARITDWGRERMRALDQWADEVLAGANAALVGTITESSVLAATTSLATYNAMLSFEGKAKAVQSINMTAEQIRAWFQDTPLGGGSLQAWVDNAFSNGVKNSLLTTIRKAGIEGKGTAATVKRIMSTALDEGFRITESEAATLARTYVQTANNQAMEAVYKANEGIIKGYKRVETLDNRTCIICALADGTEYGLHEKRPALPAHANCRGIWTPITKTWRDFGIDMDELEAVARPWVLRKPGPIGTGGRKIEEWGTTKEDFKGWWFSLNEKQQFKTSIGPVRRKLLLSAKVKWEDLTDKATGLPYTLEELGFDQRGKLLE